MKCKSENRNERKKERVKWNEKEKTNSEMKRKEKIKWCVTKLYYIICGVKENKKG